MITTKEILQQVKACDDSKVYASEKTPEQAWEQCDRGDWLLWFAVKILGTGRDIPAQKALWHARADCAELILPIYSKDLQVSDCIQGIRDYADGKISREKLTQLKGNNYSVTYAAAGSDSGNDAYDACDAHDTAGHVATYIAHHSGYEAGVRAGTLKKCAELVRARLPWNLIKQKGW